MLAFVAVYLSAANVIPTPDKLISGMWESAKVRFRKSDFTGLGFVFTRSSLNH